MDAIIEIHQRGAWQQAAIVESLGDERCRFEYLPEYVFGDQPMPLALGHPVQFEIPVTLPDGTTDRSVPPFLYDLVPQGRGRRYLVDLLRLADHEGLVMPLVLHGAFSPIGCLRLSTAVAFYRQQVALNPEPRAAVGFSLRAIKAKPDEFLQHLALHAMLAGGTTGVQGVAPKYLLTEDHGGRWFADAALDDTKAFRHWLVKLPRGRSKDDLLVHRQELAYLNAAKACGLRVHEGAFAAGTLLFVPRFDRRVTVSGVERLHQESLASVAGLRGFAPAATQNQLLAALRDHASDPLAETIEFLQRDVLNLALRNTDNHARNSAVQRLPDGTVQLTPLYDFAPMFLDPELVPRTQHWRDASGKRLDDWSAIVAALTLSEDERTEVVRALRAFVPVIERLPTIARDCGVEPKVLAQCRPAIDAQLKSLGDLPAPAVDEDDGHAGRSVRKGPRRG